MCQSVFSIFNSSNRYIKKVDIDTTPIVCYNKIKLKIFLIFLLKMTETVIFDVVKLLIK